MSESDRSAQRKAYRERNKEMLAAQNKQWKAENKEKINARNRERLETEPDLREKRRAYQREWYAKNYVTNPIPIRPVSVARRRERYATDPNYKMRQRIHSDMYKLTRGILKSGKMFDLLGCDLDSFSSHIESLFEEGMDFDNLGQWEVDHIKPLANFDLTDPIQLAIACHYSNTRPLWKANNRGRN